MKARRPGRLVDRVCGMCEKPFRATVSHVKQGWGLFCSRGCASRSRLIAKRAVQRATATERFWAQVAKSEDGCWLWKSRLVLPGYGVFTVGGRASTTGAHRFSWQLHHGPIPAGQFVCHACDQPACVRPDHLFLGTHEENMADMDAKGRRSRGTQLANARLTDAAVVSIREQAAAGAAIGVLAREFGVSRRCITSALNGVTETSRPQATGL